MYKKGKIVRYGEMIRMIAQYLDDWWNELRSHNPFLLKFAQISGNEPKNALAQNPTDLIWSPVELVAKLLANPTPW